MAEAITPHPVARVKAIGAHLRISPAAVLYRHRQGSISTFRVGGTPYATAAALDDWQAPSRAGQIPTQ